MPKSRDDYWIILIEAEDEDGNKRRYFAKSYEAIGDVWDAVANDAGPCARRVVMKGHIEEI